MGEFEQLCKPETKSRVCITVENSLNPSSVWIRLYKHGKNVFYCFYKILSSKNYNAGKDKKLHFTDQNVSSYNINLTWHFSADQSKVTFENLVIGVTACLRFTTRVSFRSPVLIFTSHNLVYILSRKHASRPITARVPFSFFINTLCAWKANIPGFPLRLSVFLFTPVFICTNKIELNYVQAYLRSCLNLKLLSLSSDSL